MNKKKNIIIVAGEESGDMYGSDIINNFSNNKNIKFYAMGLNKIKNTNAEILVDSSSLSVVGFYEVLKIYPRLLKSLNIMKKSIDRVKPDLLVLIDYQEFNMRLAKYAKSKGIKTLFYIGPQVWAWREKRIKSIKKFIDVMAVIFPFEQKYYQNQGIKSYYVGHPLIKNNLYKEENNKNKEYIGFFPGSRVNEVNKHLPIIKEIINDIHKSHPKEKFLISKSTNIDKSFYDSFFSKKNYIKILENENIYNTIDLCKIALAASGTITLQIALKKVPMCVFYKLSSFTFFLAKFLVKAKFISLVNIILNEKIVNEFIQKEATSINITKELIKLIDNENYRNNFIKKFDLLEKKLINKNPKDDINNLIKSMIQV